MVMLQWDDGPFRTTCTWPSFFTKRRKIKLKNELFKKRCPIINHVLQDRQHMCSPCPNYNKHLTLLMAWHIYCHKITLSHKRILKTTAFQYKPSLVLESQDRLIRALDFPFVCSKRWTLLKTRCRLYVSAVPQRWVAANVLWQHRERTVCHWRFKTPARNREDEKTHATFSIGYGQIITIKWQLYPLKENCPGNAAPYCLLF